MKLAPAQVDGGGLVHTKPSWEAPAPFYHSRQTDTVPEQPCSTCGAPLRKYEVEEHEAACLAIERLSSEGSS